MSLSLTYTTICRWSSARAYDHWLSTLDADPRGLLAPFPAAAMKMWPISTRVNKPENDDRRYWTLSSRKQTSPICYDRNTRSRGPHRFPLYGFRGGGLSDHDTASSSVKLYRTPALCASRSKHPAQIVRQRLSTTVFQAASGVMLNRTTVGRPHFSQGGAGEFMRALPRTK
jgi:hypothetical protein